MIKPAAVPSGSGADALSEREEKVIAYEQFIEDKQK